MFSISDAKKVIRKKYKGYVPLSIIETDKFYIFALKRENSPNDVATGIYSQVFNKANGSFSVLPIGQVARIFEEATYRKQIFTAIDNQ